MGLTKRSLLVLAVFSLLAFSSLRNTRAMHKSVVTIEEKGIKEIEYEIVVPIQDLPKDQHKDFLDAIGFQESGNRYDIVNRYGYMGRYQFGKSTLKTLRIKVSRSEFLKDTLLQEEAMTKLLMFNKKRLQKYIDKYSGETVNGVLITESGLLAAAHLGGAGSVKKWFRTGKVRRDGNGVKITSYMEKFSGYKLVLN